MALKDGDYDGRLLLVGEDGTLTNLLGGSFFLTPDKRYLIGSHDSDYQSLFVVDLARRRLVIDGEKEKLPSVDDWYIDKSGYFFTAPDEGGMQERLSRGTLVIYRLSLKNLSVTKSAISSARLKATQKSKPFSGSKLLIAPRCRNQMTINAYARVISSGPPKAVVILRSEATKDLRLPLAAVAL